MAGKREPAGKEPVVIAKPFVKGYNLGTLAGKGSFGAVYRATNLVSYLFFFKHSNSLMFHPH